MDGGRFAHGFDGAYHGEYPYEEPGKLAGSIYEDDPREDMPVVLGMLTPMPSGYLMCVIFAAEGLWFLLDIADRYDGAAGSLGSVDLRNPWHRTQWLLLDILGFGDLAAAGVGAVGLWLATHPLPLTLGKLHLWDAVLSLGGVGTLVAWRVLVVLAVVPWVGFMLAFDPPENLRWSRFLGALLYMLFNLYLLYLLFAVFRAASEANQRLQDDRQVLLRNAEGSDGSAPASGKAVVLFNCLPLEGTVGLYMMVVLVGSILWFSKVTLEMKSGGGWVFFSRFAQLPSETYVLEIVAYLTSIGFAFLGGAAVIVRRGMDGIEDEGALTLSKRCTALVLAFFLASMLRFALFVPITGMALVAGDACGIYVRLLASLSLDRKLDHGPALHCSVADWLAIGTMVTVALLDAYLIRGVLLLAQRYGAKGRSRSSAGFGADPMMAYGSASDTQ